MHNDWLYILSAWSLNHWLVSDIHFIFILEKKICYEWIHLHVAKTIHWIAITINRESTNMFAIRLAVTARLATSGMRLIYFFGLALDAAVKLILQFIDIVWLLFHKLQDVTMSTAATMHLNQLTDWNALDVNSIGIDDHHIKIVHSAAINVVHSVVDVVSDVGCSHTIVTTTRSPWSKCSTVIFLVPDQSTWSAKRF